MDTIDTELVAMKSRGQVTEEVLEGNQALNRVERTYLTEDLNVSK